MRTLDLLMDSQSLLDEAYRLLCEQDVTGAFRLLTVPLAEFRDAALRHGVEQRFVELVRNHELLPVLMQDPLTHRAFHKPRGYPGDAVLLDLIYSGQIPKGTSRVGRDIFAATSRSPGSASLQFRCELLRHYIDDAVAQRRDCRILAVGSGHCRELSGSTLLTGRCQAQFLALDADQWACKTVAREYPFARVRVAPLRFLDLLEHPGDLGTFDLIYSPSLFDYTTTAMARRLTRALLSMLRRNGRLLVGNFTPDCESRGYMDTVMDWRLMYRDAGHLAAVFRDESLSDLRTFLDPHGNVSYAEAAA
jgi:hypothetical protein